MVVKKSSKCSCKQTSSAETASTVQAIEKGNDTAVLADKLASNEQAATIHVYSSGNRPLCQCKYADACDLKLKEAGGKHNFEYAAEQVAKTAMRLTPPSRSTARPVQLHVAGDKAYVYDVGDIKQLRVEHHITGITLGTLPQVAQQNVFLGVPLQLLPEEVAVLVEERLAELVDDAQAHTVPNDEQAREYARRRKEGFAHQQDKVRELEEEKARAMREKYKDQIERRQKEKKAKKLQQQEALAEKTHGDQILDTTDPSQNTPVRGLEDQPSQETDTLKASTSQAPYSVTVATTSEGRPWYQPTPLSESTNSALSHDAALLSLPAVPGRFAALDRDTHVGSRSAVSPRDAALASITRVDAGFARKAALSAGGHDLAVLKEARIRVFKDLWSQGYFLGSGLKFGGDFLVYPGDPLRFHSHFVCTVLRTPLADISPLDIVAWGRLATAVKKSHLLAAWDERNGKVEYLSLEWAGFG